MNKKLIIFIIVIISLIFVSFVFSFSEKSNLKWTLPFRAAVASLFQSEKEADLNLVLKEAELDKLKKIITSLEDELEAEKNLRNDLGSKYNLQIDEVIKKIDNLSEKIELVIQKTTEIEIANQNKLIEDNFLEEDKMDDGEVSNIETGKKEELILCDLEESSGPKQNSVIFNEIAWMGSLDSSNHEWIELKNISEEEINLKDWQILDKDNKIKIIFEDEYFFAADSFYLLERTGDNSVPEVLADRIYSGAINNSDEALYLFNQNCELEDKVIADPDWLAGDKASKRTMERKNNLNWQDSKDAGGTPRAENSSGYYLVAGGSSSVPSLLSTPSLPSSPLVPTLPPSTEPEFCLQENLSSPNYLPVVINEVAWMGSLESHNNEWIELKNISDKDISLEGWQILDKEEQIKIIFNKDDLILADSFYLLERTDNDSVPGILADKIYTGSLKDADESLRLFNKDCNLIDEVLANIGDDLNWPAGLKEERRSMERNEDLSWHSYFDEGENGVMGTPRAVNSQLQPSYNLKALPEIIEFSATQSGENPESQILNITDLNESVLEWTASIGYVTPSVEGMNWLILESDSGITPSEVLASVDISELIEGIYEATIFIEASGTQNSPLEISVILEINPPQESFSLLSNTEISRGHNYKINFKFCYI